MAQVSFREELDIKVPTVVTDPFLVQNIDCVMVDKAVGPLIEAGLDECILKLYDMDNLPCMPVKKLSEG